jgi:PilZ domain
VTEQARFRAHARRKVRLRVVVWHPRAGWQREADVRDLGIGGACLMLKDPLSVGDRVTVSFVAPTLWDPLAIQGRVAWVGPPTFVELSRAGVAFDARDPSALFALFELMGTLDYDA